MRVEISRRGFEDRTKHSPGEGWTAIVEVTTRLGLAVCLLASGTAGVAAGTWPDAAAIGAFVEAQMQRSRLPGVAVAVVAPEEEVYAAGFSLDGTHITPDSPFVIGSVTKTLTALAVAQLADAGALRFDDAVASRLPGFALDAPDAGRTITLRHLLTHTSGLRQWSGHDRRAQRTGIFEHIGPARPSGSGFEYSSLNYIVLGQVVEAVSGLAYADYVRRHIFEPLEMRNSFTDLDSARRHGLVPGHRYLYGLTIPSSEIQQPAPLVPAGFLISSARDLGHFAGMLLNEGRFRGRQVVSAGALREMFTPWHGGVTGPGMAWGIGRARIGHAGSTRTSSARVSLLREQGYGIVVLANVNSGPFFSGTGAVMDGVDRLVSGGSAEPVRPDEVLLKLAILVLVLAGAIRLAGRVRHWSRRGFPHRLIASRRVARPLILETAAAVLVLVAFPRWIGVPVFTILEYFPDLGLAMLAGAGTGLSSALIRAFMLADDVRRTSVTPRWPAGAR
jgi:CubicO group peptidase (beta-lactamase class C family)